MLVVTGGNDYRRGGRGGRGGGEGEKSVGRNQCELVLHSDRNRRSLQSLLSFGRSADGGNLPDDEQEATLAAVRSVQCWKGRPGRRISLIDRQPVEYFKITICGECRGAILRLWRRSAREVVVLRRWLAN